MSQQLLLIYILISLIGLVSCGISESFWPIDLYEFLHKRYNLIGTWIPMTLVIIIFLPMILCMLAVVFCIFIIDFSIDHFPKWFTNLWDKLFIRKEIKHEEEIVED